MIGSVIMIMIMLMIFLFIVLIRCVVGGFLNDKLFDITMEEISESSYTTWYDGWDITHVIVNPLTWHLWTVNQHKNWAMKRYNKHLINL